jgi:hypothetical protein
METDCPPQMHFYYQLKRRDLVTKMTVERLRPSWYLQALGLNDLTLKRALR